MCCSCRCKGSEWELQEPAKGAWGGREHEGSGQRRHLEGGRALLQVLLPPGAERAAGNLLYLALADEALAVPLYVGLLCSAQQNNLICPAPAPENSITEPHTEHGMLRFAEEAQGQGYCPRTCSTLKYPFSLAMANLRTGLDMAM